MKIDSTKIALPLVASPIAGWSRLVLLSAGILAGGFLLIRATTLVAQDPPAAEEERVEVVIPDSGAVRRQLQRILPGQAAAEAPDRMQADRMQESTPAPPNPFAGKSVVLVADQPHPPYDDVEVRRVAGVDFLVIEPDSRGRGAHQLWLPLESVRSIRLFDRSQDAAQYFQREVLSVESNFEP